MDKERTISVNSDSYALWGERHVGPPEPRDKSPEEWAREREAGKITHSKMLRRYFNGDEGLLEQARTYAFPNAIARTVGKQFGGGDSELIFSVSAIENWRESLLQFAAALR